MTETWIFPKNCFAERSTAVQMRSVMMMLLVLFCIRVSAASSAAFSSSNYPVKALPLVLMVPTTEGLFAGPCVITTAKPPSFNLPFAEPLV